MGNPDDLCQQTLPPRLSPVATRPGTLGLGEVGESLAVDHLVQVHGATVLVRNWRVATGKLRGELDVVASEDATATLVICEVKTRRDAQRFGGAVAAISARKRAHLRRLTAAYLQRQARHYRHVRLDVIAVDLGSDPTLTHYAGVL